MSTRQNHLVEVLEELEKELKGLGKEAHSISEACFNQPICPICDHNLNKFHCSRCGLTFNPEDLAPNQDWIDRQNQISESF